MKKKGKIGLFTCGGVLLCLLISCGKYGRQVEEALSLSAENRYELEAVLEHFRDSTLKLRAVEFLIANMPGLYVVDSTSLAVYSPFYEKCDSIRLLYKETQRLHWATLVDSLWDVYKAECALRINYTPLLKTITAKQLITEVDMTFDAWRQNAFTKDCSFEDFCEYILPCYRGSNFVLDDARLQFNKKHHTQFYKDKRRTTLLAETDSVLSQYGAIDFDTFYGSDIPSLSVASLMKMGGGKCTERGILNSLLLSSLGVPVAVDFVPQWGNRNGAHSWNVLIENGQSFAFDPFDVQSEWVCNNLYSNGGVYEQKGQGEFRAPKIYRKTYPTQQENTLVNKGVALEDIPPLFRSLKMKDVSASYFETTDVKVRLTEPAPADAKYAYLCVFDVNGWKFVQLGKIDNKEALFRAMGRNIVYLPVYYKNGIVLPAASPFCLKIGGEILVLDGTGESVDSLVSRNVVIQSFSNRNYLKCMSGASLVNLDKKEQKDTLCKVSGILPVKRNVYKMDMPVSTHFVRINLPSDSIALGELAFYTLEGKIKNVKVVSSLQSLSVQETVGVIFDDFTSTCYRGKVKSRVVDIDLGGKYELTSIVVAPYVASQIFADSKYELHYWINGDWKLLEVQNGINPDLVFRKVPSNALFRLVHIALGKHKKIADRIFLYEGGEVLWM